MLNGSVKARELRRAACRPRSGSVRRGVEVAERRRRLGEVGVSEQVEAALPPARHAAREAVERTRASRCSCVAEQRAAELRERPGEAARRRRRRARRPGAASAPRLEARARWSRTSSRSAGRALALVERRGMRRLDAVAERLEEPAGALGRGDALGCTSNCSPGARVRTPMRSRPGAAPTSSQERPRRRRRGVRVAGHRARRSTSRTRGGVAHASASRRPRPTSPPSARRVGAERRAAARRLQADEAALARRDADRAAAVVRVRRPATMPDGDRGRRAAARAAGRVARVPRVARRAEREPARSSAAAPSSGVLVRPRMTKPARAELRREVACRSAR